jgi:hypothetical protein
VSAQLAEDLVQGHAGWPLPLRLPVCLACGEEPPRGDKTPGEHADTDYCPDHYPTGRYWPLEDLVRELELLLGTDSPGRIAARLGTDRATLMRRLQGKREVAEASRQRRRAVPPRPDLAVRLWESKAVEDAYSSRP